MKCQDCGATWPAGMKFCGQCGAKLASPQRDEDSTAERRQLTVMFCDLVGSTQLSEQLDPEDLRSLVRQYHEIATAAVERYSGHVAQYLGDGVLVYFGYPRAQEDDARRAVLTGLDIIDGLARLRSDDPSDAHPHLQVRIGIHTGLVVAGDIGVGERTDRLALGQTPNLAARVQGEASPDTLVISEATRALVAGFFECEELGERELKGVSQPTRLHRVTGASGLDTKLDVSAAAGALSPLVGRQDELERLLDGCRAARSGRGGVALVAGEAGIGKSRLLRALEERSREHAEWITCRCSPYHQNTALHPLADLLASRLGLRPEDSPEERFRHVEQELRRWDASLESAVPHVARLFALPVPDTLEVPSMSPQREKELLVDALVDIILALGRRDSAVFVVEDLHWSDPSTLELLDLVVRRIDSANVFALFSFRPHFESPWGSEGQVTRIDLERLEGQQVASLAESITGGLPLPRDVLAEIAQRTDGVPLFVEELVRMLLGSGMLVERGGRYCLKGRLSADAIPHSLQDLLTARLDALDDAKDVAQLGAVLGRRFTFPLMSAVSPLEDDELRSRLARTVDSGLVLQEGEPPSSSYVFKHALIADAAHGSLLKRHRRRLHERVARVLEKDFPHAAAEEPEVLARHFEHADLLDESITYSQRAAELASERWALEEARRHHERSLAILERLPDTLEHSRRELEIRSKLGVALISVRGYAAEEVGQTYARAEELCERIGEDDVPLRVRWGIWTVHLAGGNKEASEVMAKRWRELTASADADPDALVMAHASLACWALWRGDSALALSACEEAIARFDAAEHARFAHEFGGSGGFYGYTIKPWMLSLTGHRERADEQLRESLAVADSLGHPFTATEMRSIELYIAWANGELSRLERCAREVVSRAQEQGFFWHGLLGECSLGWLTVREGRPEDAIEPLERALAGFRATGTRMGYPLFASFLAEAHAAAGRVEKALALVDELIDLTERHVDALYDSEMHRLRGELMRKLGRETDAESCFRTAVDLARTRGLACLEQRAVASLASGGGAQP